MPEPIIAPFGSWKSPISADPAASNYHAFDRPIIDGDVVYWLELRPDEDGRCVLVHCTADRRRIDLTPPDMSVRTRVHEYGGGDYVVDGGVVYFSNFADQRLYMQDHGAPPQPLTPDGKLRYADAVIDRPRSRLIAVREDHTESDLEAGNAIVAVDLAGSNAGQILVAGNDFYAAPRLSPDGTQLAWLTWNHPNMPWDGTELWLATVTADGSLADGQLIAGGPAESIQQPAWSPDGILHYISDRSGWWNLYRRPSEHSEPLYPMAAEFGQPQWRFAQSTYGFASADRIICTYSKDGLMTLASLDLSDRRLETIPLPYTVIDDLHVTPDHAVFIGASPRTAPAVALLRLDSLVVEELQQGHPMPVPPAGVSIPQAIEFPTEHGLTAHGFFYPPHNPDYVAPAGERPPLLVMSHGGPTAQSLATFRFPIQYWTGRGIGVLDVNYGGSTGYGRPYRQRLNGQWGIVDVDDCVNGARYLAAEGLVDGARLAITGGSAGGYTTLCALTFRDVFATGASHYGISDLEAMTKDTHKFESRYLDTMVGPYPGRRDLYLERSPIHHLDRLARPMILFQGLDDPIVPPAQAQRMFEAVRAKGLPVAYVAFPGEQHGFRRAENIKRALEGELYFYGRIFGFTPADEIEPVMIENF